VSDDKRVLIDPAITEEQAAMADFERIANDLFDSCRGGVVMTEADEVRWRVVFLEALLGSGGSSDAMFALLRQEGAVVSDDRGQTYRLGRLPGEGGAI
jgi:hypothetical protein